MPLRPCGGQLRCPAPDGSPGAGEVYQGLLLAAVGGGSVGEAVGMARDPVEGDGDPSGRQRVQETPDALSDGRLLVVRAAAEELEPRPGVGAEQHALDRGARGEM